MIQLSAVDRFSFHLLIFAALTLSFCPRSLITPCCQTQGVCQSSSECAYKKVMKTPRTSPLSLTCLCSICQLTLYPKSLGENAKMCQSVLLLCITELLKLFTFLCSAYKQLNVKDEPLQLITPQFETPLPQLQPAVSFSHAFLSQPLFCHT